MKVLIGVVPTESSDDALALGGLICEALGAQPMLAHIHPAAYDYASRGHIDAEWERYLVDESRVFLDAAVEKAEQYGITDPETVIFGHRSSGVGLAEVATRHGADLIVIGSAPGASDGRFQIGSTADQLLHGSHVPVALAPAYYRGYRPTEIGRMVAAFQNSAESKAAAATAADLARIAQVPLTLLTVLVRHRIYGSALRHGEDQVMDQLQADVVAEQTRVATEVGADLDVTCATTVGDDTMAALRRYDWDGDEVLVLASAHGGIVRRVFLGDMTYKLIRATTVPALVLPRHT